MNKSVVCFLIAAWSVFYFGNIEAQIKGEIKPCTACETLMKLDIPDVRITEAVVNADQNFCNVKGIIGSEIGFELKLPERWNGRFVLGGGGGFVGSLANQASFSLRDGYATAGTNTGHEDSALSAAWALNNIERQVNFAFLAVHRTTVTSKAIIEKYYGKNPEYSYFYGCSRGGSQGLIEAWRYPEDFNGIYSEGPALSFPGLALELMDNYRLQFPEVNNSPDGVLTKQKVDLLATIIYEKYDARWIKRQYHQRSIRVCTGFQFAPGLS